MVLIMSQKKVVDIKLRSVKKENNPVKWSPILEDITSWYYCSRFKKNKTKI
jgi:hypothetical protein